MLGKNELLAPDRLRSNLDAGLERMRREEALRPLMPDLRDAGVHFVGGIVRDLCLGRGVEDIDLVVARDSAGLSRGLRARHGGALVELDPERGIYRLVLRHDLYLDIANFQAPDLLGDLAARDFTLNAMALPVDGGSVDLIDPHHGLDDLSRRELRMVSPAAFVSDPLRVLRAARLGARLELRLEPESRRAMALAVDGLSRVAMERIHSELEMLLQTAQALPWLEELSQIGAFEPIRARAGHHLRPRRSPDPSIPPSPHPSIPHSSLAGSPSLTPSIPHSLLAVWPFAHALEPEQEPRGVRLELLWAALAHDLEGPGMSLREASEWFVALRIPSRVGRKAAHIYVGPSLLLDVAEPRELVRILLELGESVLDSLVLARALGHPVAERALELHASNIAPFHSAAPLVSGADLLEAGLKPGPRIGKLIQEIELRRRLGEIETTEAALTWALEARKRGGDGSN